MAEISPPRHEDTKQILRGFRLRLWEGIRPRGHPVSPPSPERYCFGGTSHETPAFDGSRDIAAAERGRGRNAPLAPRADVRYPKSRVRVQGRGLHRDRIGLGRGGIRRRTAR